MQNRDPGWKNLDPGLKEVGSVIKIPDPQHCFNPRLTDELV